MALPAVRDSLDGLPKEVAAEYKQVGDKFHLDVTPVGGFALEDLTGLKNTLVTVKAERDAAKATAAAYTGIDPAAAKDAIEKVAAWGSMTPEKKAEELLKAKEAQLTEKFTKSESTLKAERDAAQAQLDETIRKSAIRKAIADRGGSIELLEVHALGQTKTRVAEGNKYVVDVIDASGNPRISPVGSSTAPMTIDELADELVTKFPAAFPASGTTGSGATGGSKGTPPAGAKGPVKTVSKSDPDMLSKTSLADIASGKVKVTV